MRPVLLKRSYQVLFSPDGSLCVSISKDVKAVQVASKDKAFTVHPVSHPSHIEFSRDSRFLAVKSTSGRIVILDGVSGLTVCDFDNDDDGEGSNIVFSKCGEFAVDGAWSGILRVRERSNGRVVFERGFPNTMIQAVCSDHAGETWVTSHCPKATSHDRAPDTAYFLRWAWPFPESEPIALRFRVPSLRSSALSPDGRLLAVVFGAPPTTMQVFSLADQMVIYTQQVTSGGSGSAMKWSKCSRYLGYVQKGQICVTELASRCVIRDYAMEYPCSIDFSPDGALVALGSWSSGKIVAWDDELKTTE